MNKWIIVLGGDCKGIIYPNLKGVMYPHLKGIMNTGACKGIITTGGD